MPDTKDPIPCEQPSYGPAGFAWPCQAPAKYIVEMEGSVSVRVCGRHLRHFKDMIAVGFLGKITPL